MLLDKETYSDERIVLLSPLEKRKLNKKELELFEIESFDQEITISHRLKINGIVYHSKHYTKVGNKKSSFYVKYKIDKQEFFGELSYFVQIENFFYAALYPYRIESNCFIDTVKIRLPNNLNLLKTEGVFDNVFYNCKKTNDLVIINSDSLIGKCIIYENDEKNLVFSEYLNEKEHD